MKTEEELKKLSKIKLEEYAREFDIELDRRKTKAGMITDFYEMQKSTISKGKSVIKDAPVKPIVVKSPDELVEEAKGNQQLNEFKDFIKTVKSSDVGNPTMWMLGTLGKYVTNHKIKCTTDPETGIVSIESTGPAINGKFVLK